MRKGKGVLLTVLVTAALLPHPILAGPTRAATYTVTLYDDPPPDGCRPGDCSLREAVNAANTSPAPNDILLPPGTYLLNPTTSRTAGQLVVTGSMFIHGAAGGDAANVTIDAGGTSRVFDIGSGAELRLEDLTVRNGKAGVSAAPGGIGHTHGGGIHNHGTLTLRRVIMSDNTVPGTNSQPQGGAIFNAADGAMTLSNVTLNNNSAERGGGIETAGQPGQNKAKLDNVTISANHAATGGGISNVSGTLALLNVTVASNTAGSGAGGIARTGGTMAIENTIVANNSGGNCAGTLDSRGSNLSSDGSCAASFTRPGDSNNTDPKLGPLNVYGSSGGIYTLTHALLAGSPAIDMGGANSNCPPIDQRGVSRPQDGDGNGTVLCDIGAFELEASTPGIACDPPAARIKKPKPGRQPGRAVRFKGQGSADEDCRPAGFSWDLGDGTVVPRKRVRHTYAADGTYQPTFTVTDTAGQTVSRSVEITVRSRAGAASP